MNKPKKSMYNVTIPKIQFIKEHVQKKSINNQKLILFLKKKM